MKIKTIMLGATVLASSLNPAFAQNTPSAKPSKLSEKINVISSKYPSKNQQKSISANVFIPELKETEYWMNSTWEKSSKTDYEYVNSNVLKKTIESYWNGNSYDIATRQTYNKVGNVKETIFEYYDNGSWIIDGKEEEEFDNNGNEISYKSYQYISNSYVLDYGYRQIYTNDNQNRLASILGQNYNSQTSTWVDEMNILCIYQGAANTPNEIHFQQDLGNGVLETGTKYINVTWHNFAKLELSYAVIQQLSFMSSTFENVERETTTYNSNGQELVSINEEWNGSGWDNYYKSENIYDSKNNLINRSSYYWSGTWVLSDANISNYTYNSDDIPSQIIYAYDFADGNGAVNDTKEIFTYKNVTSSKLEKANSVKIYPNPFKENLRLDLDEASLVEIFDLTGKIIYTSNEYNKNIVINTQNWEKGAYIVRLSSNNGIKTSKIVK